MSHFRFMLPLTPVTVNALDGCVLPTVTHHTHLASPTALISSRPCLMNFHQDTLNLVLLLLLLFIWMISRFFSPFHNGPCSTRLAGATEVVGEQASYTSSLRSVSFTPLQLDSWGTWWRSESSSLTLPRSGLGSSGLGQNYQETTAVFSRIYQLLQMIHERL